MILSRGRRYIFIHIPKTGGTSMALALEARAMKDDILLGDTPKARRRRHRVAGIASRGRLWKHATLADIEGLASPAEIDDFFVFTLIRNPWDRIASYYLWLRGQGFSHPAVTLAKGRGFSDFIRDPLIVRSFEPSPYASYVRESFGREKCNLFIRLEAFERDSAPLCQHLGFDLTLPRVNSVDESVKAELVYRPADRKFIDSLCAEDIERFGYVAEMSSYYQSGA
ncbi:sulfotransferase family 2 domain-containing protein [Oceanicola sp. S124]|uniref:sulfotransferase family 2 domain-containing protein n=1 Tax=Oceanicola sp. S124 TaxID=1042378 RepID=UPI0002558561|nr:sulfotransferase family 2 domain-containing protein [Oceanicola sp. S124]